MSELENVPEYVKVRYDPDFQFSGTPNWDISWAENRLMSFGDREAAQAIIDLLNKVDELEQRQKQSDPVMQAILKTPEDDDSQQWYCVEAENQNGWHWLDGNIELNPGHFLEGTKVLIFEPEEKTDG